MHQIAVIKAVKKAYTFVSDIDLSTDLLFYGLFALPRKCPAPGGFDPCPALPRSKKMLPRASLVYMEEDTDIEGKKLDFLRRIARLAGRAVLEMSP